MSGHDPAEPVVTDAYAVFLARQRAERARQGLPPTITDPAVLKLLASLVATKRPRRHSA